MTTPLARLVALVSTPTLSSGASPAGGMRGSITASNSNGDSLADTTSTGIVASHDHALLAQDISSGKRRLTLQPPISQPQQQPQVQQLESQHLPKQSTIHLRPRQERDSQQANEAYGKRRSWAGTIRTNIMDLFLGRADLVADIGTSAVGRGSWSNGNIGTPIATRNSHDGLGRDGALLTRRLSHSAGTSLTPNLLSPPSSTSTTSFQLPLPIATTPVSVGAAPTHSNIYLSPSANRDGFSHYDGTDGDTARSIFPVLVVSDQTEDLTPIKTATSVGSATIATTTAAIFTHTTAAAMALSPRSTAASIPSASVRPVGGAAMAIPSVLGGTSKAGDLHEQMHLSQRHQGQDLTSNVHIDADKQHCNQSLSLKPQRHLHQKFPHLQSQPLPVSIAGRELTDYMMQEEFAERYSLLGELGHGATGFVVAAERIEDSRIPVSSWKRDRSIGFIPLEAFLLKRINHPNIIRFLDIYEDAKYFYLVMEIHGTQWKNIHMQPDNEPSSLNYRQPSFSTVPAHSHPSTPTALCWSSRNRQGHLAGYRHTTLSPTSEKHHTRHSSLDLFEFIESNPFFAERKIRYIFLQIAEAVCYLHLNNIAHNDIKDENVVIDDALHAKLIDFGAAQSVPTHPRDYFEGFRGTTHYMPPEGVRREKYRGPEVDVWCMGGVLLYTMSFSCPPFCSPEDILTASFRHPRFKRSAALMDLITTMLQVEPLKRPTMEQVLHHSWLIAPAK
ncbi:hypothetical protein BSLG_009733 [Batrachochytrium salamandrivorans]|nr:hypothetical protein BSLG_009733 [Batrachochytrium salamandrivorans]